MRAAPDDFPQANYLPNMSIFKSIGGWSIKVDVYVN